MKHSAPLSVHSIVRMLLYSSDISSELDEDQTKDYLSISQLIKFNMVKKKKTSSKVLHHLKENETPLTLYTALMVLSKTRKERLVNELEKNGLSVSYKTVIDIQKTITKQLCKVYQEGGEVCPPYLQ